MANAGFTFTFDFPADQGLPTDALADALKGIQDALRRTVEHLGDRQPQPGRPPGWVAFQSSLRVAGVRSGSLVFDMELAPPPSQQLYLDRYGPAAIDELLNWDGEEGSTLPLPVTDRLYEIREKFSEDVKLWLGNANNQHRVELKSKRTRASAASDETEAMLYGWLREVNWYRRTAQLHDHHGEFIRLKFEPEFDEQMLRLATQYVEIRGQGRITAKDEWTTVQVGQIISTKLWNEPFDKEAFLNNPNPAVFDPAKIVRASEPFDVDEFLRYIHDLRDDGAE